MIDDRTAHWNDFQAQCHGMRACGAPLDAILARLGLPPFEQVTRTQYERLDHADAWERLWRYGAEATRDPWFAASVGAGVPFGAFEIVDYAATAAPTLGQSFKQLSRYLRLITPDLELTVDESGVPQVVMGASVAGVQKRETGILYTLGICFSRYSTRAVGGFEVEALSLASPLPPGGQPCPLESYCRTPVRYGQPSFAFTVAPEVWGRPLTGSAPGLAAVLDRHAEELIVRRGLSEGPLERVKAAIRQQLAIGDSRAESVARTLGLSVRTFHRRLQELGWTFQALLDAERREVACARLREPRLSVGEIAYLLGYSEQSAFLRAFRRWTGTTPTEYRASA